MDSQSIATVLSTVADGRTKDFRYRQRQFISLHKWITQNLEDIESALIQEDNLSAAEARFVISTTLNQLRRLYEELDLKTELAAEYSVKQGRDNPSRKVPEDLVYVIPEKFTVFSSVLNAVYACIAAGSCCLVEVCILCQAHGYGLDRYNRTHSYPRITNQPPASPSGVLLKA